MKFTKCDYCGKEMTENKDRVDKKCFRVTVRGIERRIYITEIQHSLQKSDMRFGHPGISQEAIEDVCRACTLKLILSIPEEK